MLLKHTTAHLGSQIRKLSSIPQFFVFALHFHPDSPYRMWTSALWSSLQQRSFLPCVWASTLSFAGCFCTQVGNANIPKAICQIQLLSWRKVSVPCLLPLSDRTCANLSSCLSSLFPSSGGCANSDHSSSHNSQTYVAFTGISYWLLLPGNLSLAIGRVGISVRSLQLPL